jgi:hypothetical protein
MTGELILNRFFWTSDSVLVWFRFGESPDRLSVAGCATESSIACCPPIVRLRPFVRDRCTTPILEERPYPGRAGGAWKFGGPDTALRVSLGLGAEFRQDLLRPP